MYVEGLRWSFNSIYYEQGYRAVYGEMDNLIASWGVERLGTTFLKDILKNMAKTFKSSYLDPTSSLLKIYLQYN